MSGISVRQDLGFMAIQKLMTVISSSDDR